MKRSELPLYKELEKKEKAVLKSIARQHGWRQSSYIEWKIESGYFLCLDVDILGYVLCNISLEIKPLFIDDLWWDVFNMSSNKNEPMSLRGIGCFAVRAPRIAKYDVLDPNHALDYSQASIENKLEDVFKSIDKDIYFNIYTIDGKLVRQGVKSAEGLGSGIYIVNGKKVIVQ